MFYASIINQKQINILQEAGHIENTVVLIFRHSQCLHFLYSEIYSGTHVQPLVILDPVYLPDYLSVSYDYVHILMILIILLTTQKYAVFFIYYF